MEERAQDLQREQDGSFDRAEGPRLEQARPGRAEKSNNERAHHPLNHQPHMRICRIKLDRVPHVQWPERDADRTEQEPERKENSKRLRETKREKFLRIHRA